MTLDRLIRRGYLLRAWGWETDRLSTGALLELWRDVLALLYRDHSIRALSELTGITTYQISKELAALGIQARPQGSTRRRKEDAQGNSRRPGRGGNDRRRAGWLYGNSGRRAAEAGGIGR